MPWLNALFNGGLVAYLAGTAAGIAWFHAPRRARIGAFGFALTGALLEIAAAVVALARGGVTTWNLPSGVPLFLWIIRVNALSAYFNLTLGILAAAVSVYSFGYVRPMEGRRNIGVLGCFYNILLLSLTLVFVAGNAFFFLVAWEVMALSGWRPVSSEQEKERTRRAGMLFLIMSQAGSGLPLVAFLILGRASGILDFATFHHVASTLPAWQQGAVFLLFFLGFGVKAGV